MARLENFITAIKTGYDFDGIQIQLGAAVLDKAVVPSAAVRVPLAMLNRHGLIAGATGSGKTKTLQLFAEQLSKNGVPSLVMDIKGDLSGLAMPGVPHPKIAERQQNIALQWRAEGNTVELFSLSDEKGARLRATVSEFGPVLFSRILGLNDTQSSIVSVIFKYCDDHSLPLLDLKDFKKVLNYMGNEGKDALQAEYGMMSSASIGSILRKVVELEQQGAEKFFGEISFDVEDLIRLDENGRGIISILRLSDIQDRPKLFSTFMLQLLAELYQVFPEAGDIDQPKLCIFIDEAHLVFQEASDALMSQIESIIKLIRSKGIGVYFVTQNPQDIPNAVLGQLGLKIQHALRAFTAKDRKDIKLAAQNYPITEWYDTETLLTELGIGEAFVTVLNNKGIPTPLVHTYMRAPESRMDVLTPTEIEQINSRSAMVSKYNQIIDRESAYEMLSEKIEDIAAQQQEQAAPKKQQQAASKPSKEEKSVIEKAIDSPLAKQVGRTVVRELTRGLLGVFGLGGGRSTRKKGWF